MSSRSIKNDVTYKLFANKSYIYIYIERERERLIAFHIALIPLGRV